MHKKQWIILAAALAGGAAVVVGTTLFLQQKKRRDDSDAKLKEAHEILESARSSGDWNKSRNLLVQARTLASEAAGAWPGNAVEAATVEGEALLRLTKYRDAIFILEKALQERRDDGAILRLAAESYHLTYLTGRKEADLGRAVNLYDQAISQGAGIDVLLLAAKINEESGHPGAADKYFDKIEAMAPDSREAQEARNMKALRPGNSEK